MRITFLLVDCLKCAKVGKVWCSAAVWFAGYTQPSRSMEYISCTAAGKAGAATPAAPRALTLFSYFYRCVMQQIGTARQRVQSIPEASKHRSIWVAAPRMLHSHCLAHNLLHEPILTCFYTSQEDTLVAPEGLAVGASFLSCLVSDMRLSTSCELPSLHLQK